ncbi:MAG: alpha/beta hydrolase [Myxococcales bacterium]|nr:alpha/beta hydrolase [Myxococcales bacterium]
MAQEPQRKSAPKEREGGAGRWLWFLFSIVVGLPLLALCGLTLIGPPSMETAVFAIAVLVTVIGGLMGPFQKNATWGARAGFLILLGVVGYRFMNAESSATIRTYTGPVMTEGRWLDRIAPERDVALGGSNLLLILDQIHEPGLLDALRDGYDRMRRAEGPVPSSVVSTFVLGQTPADHTVFRISPNGQFDAREAVVIFLHGYIGNVTLECWQVAQAANPVGLEVVCPSTEYTGSWELPDGRAIVEAHIERLRGQGVRRIYLAGLSAGAIGASRLAPSLDIEGLILISGASRQATPAAVPTLILQGARDTMTPPGLAREYAQRAGRRATYREYDDATHWLILSHHEAFTNDLRHWLAEREGLGVVHE